MGQEDEEWRIEVERHRIRGREKTHTGRGREILNNETLSHVSHEMQLEILIFESPGSRKLPGLAILPAMLLCGIPSNLLK